MNKKYVIYSSLTGGYDELRQPLVVDERFDYICFTNDFPEGNIGVWQIKRIPYDCKDNIRLSRYVKLLPHKVLADYEYSLWMDTNIQITKSIFYEYVMNQINNQCLISQVNHAKPPVDCIYDEIKFAFLLHKVRFFPAIRQKMHLKRNHFPKHFGLFENNIILRRHGEKKVKNISEQWWYEYCRFSKRDQFSLMYVYWKNKYLPSFLLKKNECSRNVDFLNIESYHKDEIRVKKSLIKKLLDFPDKVLYHLEYTRPNFFLYFL